LRALESRVAAQLATLEDDSVLGINGVDSTESVRTLVFASDHRCEVSVRSKDNDQDLSMRFQTDTQRAVDIELWQTASDASQTIRAHPTEPATFDGLHAGPMRVVYSVPDASGARRRYQTEWVLLP
jgi:hypothetical protein